MNIRYWVRKLHRWIGVAVAIQLIAWTTGGLYFSLIPIEEIRGEHLVHESKPISTSMLDQVVAPNMLADELGDAAINRFQIVQRDGRLLYRATTAGGVRLFDALTGESVAPVTQDEAESIATTALIPEASIEQTRLIEAVPRGHEYRGGPLPAYQIDFDHDSGIRLYVAQQTGEITARRTDRWRIFDFLWMLHVMDYQDRDDFNHPLLTLAATVALFVLLSGVLLWWQTTPLRRRVPARN